MKTSVHHAQRSVKCTTPKKYDPDAIEASNLLCGKNPIDVPIQVEPSAKDAFCWFNVLEKVPNDGGEPVYGWMFYLYRRLQILAYPHAVWKSPSGSLIDVTPPQHPTLNPERTLFAQDDYLHSILANAGPETPLPTYRIFPFKLRRLWPLVVSRCSELDRLRLAGKEDEAEAVAQKLENSLNAAIPS